MKLDNWPWFGLNRNDCILRILVQALLMLQLLPFHLSLHRFFVEDLHWFLLQPHHLGLRTGRTATLFGLNGTRYLLGGQNWQNWVVLRFLAGKLSLQLLGLYVRQDLIGL
jgi:hypothetical protein